MWELLCVKTTSGAGLPERFDWDTWKTICAGYNLAITMYRGLKAVGECRKTVSLLPKQLRVYMGARRNDGQVQCAINHFQLFRHSLRRNRASTYQ